MALTGLIDPLLEISAAMKSVLYCWEKPGLIAIIIWQHVYISRCIEIQVPSIELMMHKYSSIFLVSPKSSGDKQILLVHVRPVQYSVFPSKLISDALSLLSCWVLQSVSGSAHVSLHTTFRPLFVCCVLCLNVCVMSVLNSAHFMKVLVTVEVQFEMNKPLFCHVESSDGALCVVCSSMCGARSNHCEVTAVHPHSVSVMAGQGSLCSRPFLAAVFMRRRCLCGCIWRDVDDVTEWKFIFLCKSMFVEQIEIYRWVLFMFACSALFSSTLLPLHRAADNVLCLCLERHHEAQRENFTKVLSLKTQFVTFASFKGAIVVSFFWAVNVSNIYFGDAELSTPVAYAVWTI